MKHKAILALLTASIGIAATGMLAACGDDETEEPSVNGTQGLSYELSSDGLSYAVSLPSEGNWENADIVIPASYQGKPVTAVADFGFSDGKIKSVTVPDSVTTIGDQAFDDCENLTTVTFGNGVTSVGRFAFSDSAVKSITLPASVTEIGAEAFNDCEFLTSFTLYGNATVKRMAFYGCTALTTAEFLGEESLTLEGDIFYDCSALDTLTISAASVTFDDRTFFNSKPKTYAATFETIYKSRFQSTMKSETPKNLVFLRTETFSAETPASNLSKVESITLPATLKTCEQGAFTGYGSLNKVVFDGTIADWCGIEFESLDSNPIDDVAELTIGGNTVAGKLTVPAGVAKIGDYAFAKYERITELEISAGVTEIGKYAFYDDELTVVTLPNGLEKIGDYAFRYNENLYRVDFSEGLKEIGTRAFQSCKLIEITLPQSLQTLGEEAFRYNATLTRIINLSALTEAQVQSGTGTFSALSDYFELITEADGSAVETVGDFVFWKDDGGAYYLMNYAGSDTEITLPAQVKGNAYAIHAYAFGNTSLEKITFEDTANWYRQYNYGQAQPVDVTDGVQNATYLQTTYKQYEWYQIKE